jgi:hypothetical protein
MNEQLQNLVNVMYAQGIDRLIKSELNACIPSFTVVVVDGPKYTKVNKGAKNNLSGCLMIENSTGQIYGILGYGQVNKKKCYGNISDISGHNWGGYYPVAK